MDRFDQLLNAIGTLGQGILHIYFVSRLTGKTARLWHFAIYSALLCAVGLAAARLSLGDSLSIAAGVFALYGMERLALGAPPPVAGLAAVLAFYISQLSYGIIDSIELVVFPRFIGRPLLYLLLLIAQPLFFALCVACYRAVLRLLPDAGERQTPYIGLLLFPCLFFFGAELYILQTAYTLILPTVSWTEVGRQTTLLLLQAMGLAAMLCTLYAYRQLCRGFQAESALRSLTQAAQAQKVYIAEARQRYERTKAFRHDIRNHLAVLDGLLGGGRLDEGRAYLKRLETVSGALSFPYQTGNPVVDILLGEKLAQAEGIRAEVSLLLPQPCGIDDFDLCVIFANALDNALAACREVAGARSIRIAGKRQGDFYMLTFENTCPDRPLPPAGVGLSNIRSVAEKYRGAVLTETDGRQFSLNVLLDLSE